MSSFFTHNFFFYEYLIVFFFVGVESIGIPLPGETALVTAAIYAGTSHKLNIAFVILTAIAGAIIGDNIGFWIGKEGGHIIIRRYRKRIGFTEGKIKLGMYLFKKHGGKIVFYGRFFSLLRTLAAFLAGVNNMSWKRFLIFNAAGAVVWSVLFGIAGYTFGKDIHKFELPVKIITVGMLVAIVACIIWYIRRNEKRLEKEAEKAMPGALEKYQT